MFKGKNLFHAKRIKFRGITKFDDSFLFKRMQENELQGISKTQMKIVIYAKTVKRKA